MTVDIITGTGFAPTMGPYSPATRAGQFIFVSGQGGIDPFTGTLVAGGIKAQTRQAITNLRTILEAAGSDLAHVAMTTVLLHDWEHFDGMNEVFGEFFGAHPPARSTIVGERRPEGSLVAISVVAVER